MGLPSGRPFRQGELLNGLNIYKPRERQKIINLYLLLINLCIYLALDMLRLAQEG